MKLVIFVQSAQRVIGSIEIDDIILLFIFEKVGLLLFDIFLFLLCVEFAFSREHGFEFFL